MVGPGLDPVMQAVPVGVSRLLCVILCSSLHGATTLSDVCGELHAESVSGCGVEAAYQRRCGDPVGLPV